MGGGDGGDDDGGVVCDDQIIMVVLVMLLVNDNENPKQHNIFLYLSFYFASIKILMKMAWVKIDFVDNRKYIDAGETCRVRGDC